MTSSLRWRIVLVVVVALFALALVWPTIRWATLNPTAQQKLNLLYFEWNEELRDDLEYSRIGDKAREALLEERAALQKRLEDDLGKLRESDLYKALPKYDQRKEELKLELRARTPQFASLWRNVRRDVYRWWHGDEDKILRLGLDLKGGIYMVLETDPEHQDQVYETLKNRIDQFGVAEPILVKQGDSRIVIQLPGATDIDKAKRLVTEKAEMKWMLVDEELQVIDEQQRQIWTPERLLGLYDAAVEALPDRGPDPLRPEEIIPYKDEKGNVINFDALDEKLTPDIPADHILRVYEETDEQGNKRRDPLLLREPYVVSGNELRGQSCRVTQSSYGQPVVAFEIGETAAKRRFADTTKLYSAEGDHAIDTGNGKRGWRLAILLDNKVISAPNIRTAIGSRGVIEGNFTYDEASLLALQLRSGSLPARIDIAQNLQVGPTLGADSIRMGWRAAVIGLALVVVFMAIYYRISGVFAVVALGINMVLILGALAAARATLTLPGIAGIILTIGMAVDANVLIFERIREELAGAKKLKAALDAGYHKALRTILDANITTLITAFVLFLLGTGPVRGFAVTLSIGICMSVFSAIVITRVLFDLLLLNKSVATLKMFQFFRKPSFDFIKWRKVALFGSAAVIVIGLAAFGTNFQGNFGIDFRGGTEYRLDFGGNEVKVDDVRSALTRLGITDATVHAFDIAQSRQTKIRVEVRGTPQDNPALEDLPERVATAIGVPLADSSSESISASVSKDLARKTVVAFVLALLGILIYVSWRFEFSFALGAIVALIHDVLVTVGLFAGFFILTRRQINTPTIAAFLTIVGYSLNDTIVIFDRVREDLKILKRLDFRTIINTSINQTLSRTVLTSLTTLLVVIALFILGGQAINDFSFAMLVGIIVGTYSTVYIASPIVLLMHREKTA